MQKMLNYINGEWIEPKVKEYFDVINPATGEVIAKTPLCGADAVDAAAKAAADAFPAWRRTPVQDRIQYLFKLRDLLKANNDEIARTITNESGKTFEEAKAEMVRAIENVEVACGMPHLMKGELVEDIAPGIDEMCDAFALAGFGLLPKRTTIAEWVEEMNAARHDRLDSQTTIIAGQRNRPVRGSMVGTIARQNLISSGVKTRNFYSVFISLRAAQGKKCFLEITGSHLGQLLAEQTTHVSGITRVNKA